MYTSHKGVGEGAAQGEFHFVLRAGFEHTNPAFDY